VYYIYLLFLHNVYFPFIIVPSQQVEKLADLLCKSDTCEKISIIIKIL
jgi:hypothetical protein